MFIDSFKTAIKAILVLFCFVALFSNAQADATLTMGSNSGDPGDTVALVISLDNPVDSISGISLRITYNSAALYPIDIKPTTRTNFFYEIPSNSWVVTNRDPGVVTLFAATWRHEYMLNGSGAIGRIYFVINEGAAGGNYPINFENVNVADNSLSDLNGVLIIPTLNNGSLTVSGSSVNNAPTFNPVNNQYAYDNMQLQFNVSATDSDNDNLELDAQGLPAGASFPTAQGQGSVQSTFTWTPQLSGQPDTSDVIFRVKDQYHQHVTVAIKIFVNSTGGNRPPIIYSINSQSVNEGNKLEFEVSSYDLDGDYVTLEAYDLPPNSSFPMAVSDSAVTGTFTFTPDFNQGPDTVTVHFVASDDHNNETDMYVDIVIFDTPNDILEIRVSQGALPGSINRKLFVDLSNSKPVYGLQFDLLYYPGTFEVLYANPYLPRTENLWFAESQISEGRYRVLIISTSPDSDSISAGKGEIVNFDIDVNDLAVIGPSFVTFDSAYTVQDIYGGQKKVLFSSGTFTIDELGDANLDGLVAVGDCITIIAQLLGRVEYDERSFDAGDYNRDGDVRISDLQGVVDHILHAEMPMLAPPVNAGSIELLRADLYPGYSGEVPLWLDLNTPAAAVQFTVEYDPSNTIVKGITPGEMVSDLSLEINDLEGEIRGVIYTFDLTEFGPAAGELVNLDVDFIGSNIDPRTAVRLTDFEIVALDASKLQVDIVGELPKQIALYQNYPNPFNAKTTIAFDLPNSSTVQVDIYNMLGQKVKELRTGQLQAGHHMCVWDGTGSDGEEVTSGVYFYRLTADGYNKTKKMLLVK